MASETMQVKQTKITIASRYSLFLYIDNIIQNKTKRKIVVLEKKKKKYIWPEWRNALNKYEMFFSSITMSPKT